MVSGAFVLAQRARDATRAAVFLGAGWCLAWLLLIRAAAVVAPIYSGVDLAAAFPPTQRDVPALQRGDLRSIADLLFAANRHAGRVSWRA